VSGDRLELVAELLGRGREVKLRARGGSMRPALDDGDVLTLGPLSRAPRPGEIVAVLRGGFFAIHRVDAANPSEARLRGDACAEADGWFAAAEVLGKVIAVQRGSRRLSAARLGGVGGFALLLLRPLTRAWLRWLGALGRAPRAWYACTSPLRRPRPLAVAPAPE
jgi:Peptidase S24-like